MRRSLLLIDRRDGGGLAELYQSLRNVLGMSSLIRHVLQSRQNYLSLLIILHNDGPTGSGFGGNEGIQKFSQRAVSAMKKELKQLDG